MKLTRRDALKIGGLAAVGTAGLTLPFGRSVSAGTPSLLSSANMPKPYAAAFARLEVLTPRIGSDANGPIHYYDIAARSSSVGILPNLKTPVLGYDGLVPAKRIDVEQGTRIKMTMRNKLPPVHPAFGTPLAISTHLHGSASLPQYDGYASDVTLPEQKKYYSYPNGQKARTLWYHDHGVHYTAQNAYSGLASQYHLHDPVERALLPQGEFDVALTVSDMMFNADGSQQYDDRSHSGLWGDVILVNGRPWPLMRVKKRIYRFRFLNASLSRSYRPSLSNGAPVYMVATDGGLMPKTQAVTQWRHGSAERYEFLVDFRSYKAGTRIELKNLSNPNNRDYDNTGKIMAFDVVDDAFDRSDATWSAIPTLLDPGNEVMAQVPTSSTKVRNIRVQRNDTTNEWNLNGESWHDVVDSDYKKVLANPDLGDTEIWEIENKSGGWFHPVHIHLIDFKILDRNGKPPFSYELGPKDVVYVGEGEKVRVVMKFGPHRGKYMVHCHNLPHEDHDMMHQFSVGLKDTDIDDNDPIKADPAVDDSDDDH
ncbi:multicopper oxidase family protein [uncultured Friedmanniella sp.]|uniref:multicopper oxidase family protein n=1 Tax=uncultured Friedmanniella sp. TaxID=335381 RepID=UPI0035C99030